MLVIVAISSDINTEGVCISVSVEKDSLIKLPTAAKDESEKSDSIFEFNGRAFGKPSDKEEAYRRWLKMSGEFGFLHTGHTLLISNFDLTSKEIRVTKIIKKTISSKVCFSTLQDAEIKKYVDSLEPLYCAGGFALEGKGGKYIEKIDGCFSNVMGLSLPWLRKSLINEGILT